MFPFSKLGIVPEFGSSLLLPTFLGMARAKQLLLTSEWFSAEEVRRSRSCVGRELSQPRPSCNQPTLYMYTNLIPLGFYVIPLLT
jgi:hypothetical protein